MQKIAHRKYLIVTGLVCLLLLFIYLVSDFQKNDRRRSVKPSAKTIHLLTWRSFPDFMIDQFQADNPGYIIQVERYSQENYLSYLKTKLKSAGEVDIIEIPTIHYPELADSSLLYDLSSEPFLTRLQPESINYMNGLTADTPLSGIPYESEYMGIWYNRAIFEKYDLAPPDTTARFLKACRVLSDNKIAPVAAGLSDYDNTRQLFSLFLSDVLASEPDFFTQLNNNPQSLNSSLFTTAAAGAYHMLSIEYLSEECISLDSRQAFDLFLGSSYAMAIGSEHNLSMLTAASRDMIDIGVCPVQISFSNTDSFVLGTPAASVFSIYNKSKNTDICLDFLDYMTRYDTVFEYMELTGRITNIQKPTHSDSLYTTWNDIKAQPYLDIQQYFYLSPYIGDRHIASLPEKLFRGLIDPETFTNTLIYAIETENYHVYGGH